MKAKFDIGEYVAVNFGYPGAFGSSKIIGIIQTTGAVKYNVQVILSKPHVEPKEVTRLYNVEERFIMSRQDWLDLNQKDYGKEKPVVLDGLLAYTFEDHPEKADDITSVDVIVDPDGKNKEFYFGWYSYKGNKWYLTEGDESIIDPEHMTWIYNPFTHPNGGKNVK